MKVLVVDDSAVFRQAITKALEPDSEIEVVGTAANGELALRMIPLKKPDVVILDVEMPQMDGIETLRHIRKDFPLIKVIMFSAHTQKGATATIEALSLGAIDFVTKPTGASLAENIRIIQEDLIPSLKAIAPSLQTTPRPAPAAVQPRPRMAVPPRPVSRPRLMVTDPPLVAIGISTGGPNALSEILPKLPADFPSPIVITQHMPPVFTEQLANRLDRLCPLKVVEAKHGDPIQKGHIYIAPGDFHMEIERNPGAKTTQVKLHQGPKECSCRPSVDVMFRSIAASWGTNVIGVIMTGMGSDGFEGSKILKSCDAYLIAQDEPSCVVYGMPSFIVNGGLADEVLPLQKIPIRLNELVRN